MNNPDTVLKAPVSVLIVDDEPEVVEYLCETFADTGYRIHSETDPQKALLSIAGEPYDLVITDLQMPGISGLDIIQMVRKTERDTEVIVITGYASIDSAIESIHYGVYDYLQKPFSVDQIFATVNRALEKQQMRRENLRLQRENQRMLSDITLLNEISGILYQITDFEQATRMVLDTLGEALDIRKAALMVDDHRDGIFRVAASRGLGEPFTALFNFSGRQRINGLLLPRNSNLAIDLPDGEFALGGRRIKAPKGVRHLWLLPVQYLDQVVGYLAVFLTVDAGRNTHPRLEGLLKILGNQVGPVLYNHRALGAGGSGASLHFYQEICEKLDEARALSSQISFSLLRIGIRDLPDIQTLTNEILPTCKDLLVNILDREHQLIWQSWDQALLILPGADLFTTERLCFEIRRQLERMEVHNGKPAGVTLRYASECYPQFHGDAAALTGSLWRKLFVELEKPVGQPVEESHSEKISL